MDGYKSHPPDKNESDIPLTSIDLTREDSRFSYTQDDDHSLNRAHSNTHPSVPSSSSSYLDHPQLATSVNNLAYNQEYNTNPYPVNSYDSYSNGQNTNGRSFYDQSYSQNPVNPFQNEINQNHIPPYPGYKTQQLNETSSEKAHLLRSVPEEDSDTSSSDEDEDLVDLRQVVDTLKTKNLTKELNKDKTGSNSADSNTLNGDYDERTTKGHNTNTTLLSSSSSFNENNDSRSQKGSKRRGFRRRATEQPQKKKNSSETKSVTILREVFAKIYRMSLLFRCLIFWFPLAALLFIPLAVGAWAERDASIGHVPLMWIFIWLEVVWGAIFVSLLVAKMLPALYYFITSIIAPSLKKYRSVITAMQVPITMVFSALIAVSTFMPVMTRKKNASEKDANFTWQKVVQNILVAVLISTLIYCAERFVIHLISVSFHKKRFSNRIKDNKKAIIVIAELLYAACTVFPPFCPEFMEEDLQLQSGKLYHNMASGKNGFSKILAKNKNVQRIFGKFNHAVDLAANNFDHQISSQPAAVMESIDDLKVWCNNVVTDSMSSKSLAQVLAIRIWMSLVLENENALTMEDLVDVLGPENKGDYEALFQILDQDGNGDLTLEEMKSATRDIARERKSIYKSLKDVDTAIAKLHSVLLFIIMIIIVIVFIGMLAPSVTAVLATLGTTILGLSFIFSTTCQEICASCVFLFVKHPIDVGDRVNILTVPYLVREMSLLSTVFTRISDNSVVQAPNSVLNTLWIDNFSRSGPQAFNIDLSLGLPETSFEQLQEFNNMLDDFCLNNPRDYLPEPFFYITSYPELDCITVTVIVTFRSNFADGMLYSKRRNKLLRFLGRCINEINIHIPRREDTSTDPGLPSYFNSVNQLMGSSATTSDVVPFVDGTNRNFEATGKRGALGFPEVPLEYMDTVGTRRARMGFAPEKTAESEELKENEQTHFDSVFADEQIVETMQEEHDRLEKKKKQARWQGHGTKPSVIPEEAEPSDNKPVGECGQDMNSTKPFAENKPGHNDGFSDAAAIPFPGTDGEKLSSFPQNAAATASGAQVATTVPANRAGRSGTIGRHDTMTSRNSGASASITTGMSEDTTTGRRKRANSALSGISSPVHQKSIFSPQLQLQLQQNPSAGLSSTRSQRHQEKPLGTDDSHH